MLNFSTQLKPLKINLSLSKSLNQFKLKDCPTYRSYRSYRYTQCQKSCSCQLVVFKQKPKGNTIFLSAVVLQADSETQSKLNKNLEEELSLVKEENFILKGLLNE